MPKKKGPKKKPGRKPAIHGHTINKIINDVATGVPMTKAIAAHNKDEVKVSVSAFYGYLRRDEKLMQAYRQAQVTGSYARHDKAVDLAEAAMEGRLPGESQNPNVYRLGFDIAKWSNKHMNPDVFGDGPQTLVQVNMVDDLLGDSREGGKNPLEDVITVEQK